MEIIHIRHVKRKCNISLRPKWKGRGKRFTFQNKLISIVEDPLLRAARLL